MITIENKRIVSFLQDKDKLVAEGIKISKELEKIEYQIQSFERKEKAITGKVRPSKEKEIEGQALIQRMDADKKAFEKILEELEQEKLAAVPADMKKAHQELLEKRSAKETERNKIALKVQKIKDRVIPIIQKEVKPLLKREYDDMETARLKDGKCVVTTFNHLDEWKKRNKDKR